MQKLTDFFRKHQKLIFIFALLVSILFVVFSLCFSTDFIGLERVASEERDGVLSAIEPYNMLQAFNKTIFNLSLIYILISVALFIYLGHKRRIYYKTNIVTISLYVLYSLFISVFVFISVMSLFQALNTVDYEAVKKQLEYAKIGSLYSESRFWLYAGIVVSIVAIIQAAVMCLNMVLRLRAISIERKELGLNACAITRGSNSGKSGSEDNSSDGDTSALQASVDNIDNLTDVSPAVGLSGDVKKGGRE